MHAVANQRVSITNSEGIEGRKAAAAEEELEASASEATDRSILNMVELTDPSAALGQRRRLDASMALRHRQVAARHSCLVEYVH